VDTGDEAGRDPFIRTSQDDDSEPSAEFDSGLKQDIEAAKNGFRYPAISHGPMEGTNNKIKMVRRRGYGRAELELLNALFTLPGLTVQKNPLKTFSCGGVRRSSMGNYDLDPTQEPYPEAA